MGYTNATSRIMSFSGHFQKKPVAFGHMKDRPMLQGRASRHNVLYLIGPIVTIAFACGCEQIPTPRANTAPIHIPQASSASIPSAQAPNASASDPSLVATNHTAPSIPTTEATSVSKATPLIDEALARAEEIKRIGQEEEEEDSEKTEVKPATNNITLASVSPSTPSATPAPTPTATASPKQDDEASPPKENAELAASPAKKPLTAIAAVSSPPIDSDKPVPPPKAPVELWREGLERLRKLTREQQHNADPSVSTWTLREQLLDLLDQSEDRVSLRRSVLKSFLSLGSEAQAPEDQERGNEIREAVAAIEEQAPLEITDLRLCRKVTDFGKFDVLDATDCKAGQKLLLYCEMSGVRYAEAGETFHSRLNSQVKLIPSQGGDPVWNQELGPADDFCHRRRRDYFVTICLTLPDNLEPGSYDLLLIQEDELASRSTSSKVTLTIHP